MNLDKIKNFYFVGIGGIGMSALARYFCQHGKNVAGYDRTATALTQELEAEGIHIHFDDNPQQISPEFANPADTLVVYTPAIPDDHKELNHFINNGFVLVKRSAMLGLLTKDSDCTAIAGTHGKTTITTLTTHILNTAQGGVNAFLGGISKNYNTNLLTAPGSNIVVVEADEYARSFLTLHPKYAVVSAIDADHLDIYGTKESVIESFIKFIRQIKDNGALVIKKGLLPDFDFKRLNISKYTYSLDQEADFFARVKSTGLNPVFDLHTPFGVFNDLVLGIPGLLNIENAVAASAMALLNQTDENGLRRALASFKGIKRRFDIRLINDRQVYIDDYAHHPEELRAFITSVRNMLGNRKITGIFQPHLYSRTKDFAAEFAQSLDLLDEAILLDIYPAREEPIEGVSSALIFDAMTLTQKSMMKKSEVLNSLKINSLDVLLTMGAGDIDTLCEDIVQRMTSKD